MVFNSMPFVLFFVVVFFVYWFPLKNTMKGQNIFLLVASWFFYGYADWRMLLLLLVATAVFFYLGKGVGSAKSEKRSYWLTFLGVALGVGTLLYFKYFNFFIESFARLFEACGVRSNLHTFNILIPLGISFFTFRLLSYVIDIRRGKMEPTGDFVAFATYIAFFPCILSGPIDRPQFIKQLQTARVFNYDMAVDGCRQFLWGLFKKMVVADNCATYVNQVWDSVGTQSGSTLVFSAILYLFQIYADFSGYSDMAIGVGKLLGLKIADNFKFPLFSLNIADYWRHSIQELGEFWDDIGHCHHLRSYWVVAWRKLDLRRLRPIPWVAVCPLDFIRCFLQESQDEDQSVGPACAEGFRKDGPDVCFGRHRTDCFPCGEHGTSVAIHLWTV